MCYLIFFVVVVPVNTLLVSHSLSMNYQIKNACHFELPVEISICFDLLTCLCVNIAQHVNMHAISPGIALCKIHGCQRQSCIPTMLQLLWAKSSAPYRALQVGCPL